MKTFKEFKDTISEEVSENNIQEAFRQTTTKKLIKEYLKKVKPEEVLKKGNIRFNIEDGFYIEFSSARNDNDLLGYRIDINSRCIKCGMGDTLFYDWTIIYSEYYNITTKKSGKSFNEIFA